MEPLGESVWYYIYVPAFVQNVIISANEAAVQTSGDVVEAGREVWIAVADDLATTVSYEAQADVEIPEYVETYTVHAYVPLEGESVSSVGESVFRLLEGRFLLLKGEGEIKRGISPDLPKSVKSVLFTLDDEKGKRS